MNSNRLNHKVKIEGRTQSQKQMWWALLINVVFLAIEILGAIFANSIALFADAGHMLVDVASLILALAVGYLARRPATTRRTFGLLRAEVLAAFINGAMLIPIVGFVYGEAWKRLQHPQHVAGPLLLAVATVGLLANLGSSVVLAKGRSKDVNLEGVFLHMVADSLAYLGAVVAGLVIWTTGWYPIDSIASMLIGLFILRSSWVVLKRSANILLEATPEGIDFMEVKQALEAVEHVIEIHDLHIWTITKGMPVLAAHMTLDLPCSDTGHWQECLKRTQEILKERFGIPHSTIQVESVKNQCDANDTG